MPAPKRVTPQDIARWTQWREREGLSYKAISKRTKVAGRKGFSASTVADHIGDGQKIGERYRRQCLTPEQIATMKELRASPNDWSYEAIAERFDVAMTTVARHVGDGRRVPPKPLNASSERVRRRRASAAKWKANNPEKVRANGTKWTSYREWKRNGSPPPKNGRTCSCATPLGAQGEPCGWCSYLIRTDAT